MRRLLPMLALALATGCGDMDIEKFAETKPNFRPEVYFDGETRAWGIFEDRFDDLRRQFSVTLKGYQDEDVFVLEEYFLFDDGEDQQRTWRFAEIEDGRYEGRADDVIGVADGMARGNAFKWSYAMDLKTDDGPLRVSLEDWMFLQPDGVLVNRARVRKWGVEIGQISIFFMKPNAEASFAVPFTAPFKEPRPAA